jgi:hypothetical protein
MTVIDMHSSTSVGEIWFQSRWVIEGQSSVPRTKFYYKLFRVTTTSEYMSSIISQEFRLGFRLRAQLRWHQHQTSFLEERYQMPKN